jgi:hypothetical protein
MECQDFQVAVGTTLSMKLSRLSRTACLALLLTAFAASVPAATPTSSMQSAPEWPRQNVAKFIFDHIDLTTFRNSTGPRRKPGQRFFADLGIHAGNFTETRVVSDLPDWTYVIQILGKHDYNGDGVEEVAICFSDAAANGGNYRASHPYLVQILEGRVVALAFEIDSLPEARGCERVPGASR